MIINGVVDKNIILDGIYCPPANLLANELFANWTGGLPDDWQVFGSYNSLSELNPGVIIDHGDENSTGFQQRLYNPYYLSEKNLAFAMEVKPFQTTSVIVNFRLFTKNHGFGPLLGVQVIAVPEIEEWQVITHTFAIPDISSYEDNPSYGENAYVRAQFLVNPTTTPWLTHVRKISLAI